MTAKIIGTVLVMILFFGCRAKHDDKSLTINDSIRVHKVAGSKVQDDSMKISEDFDFSDCIRGQAESVIKRAVYPTAIFKLNPDNYTGTETVDLENGEKLIINNWGCEYFVLTFRFETERFEADTTDIKYWLGKAAILMGEIETGLDAPLDIKDGTLATVNFLKGNKDYRLGEEIVYDDDVIRDFVTLDRIQKLKDKSFAIEISYATGPLWKSRVVDKLVRIMDKNEALRRYFHENVLRSYIDYKTAFDKRAAGRGNNLYVAKKTLKFSIAFENISLTSLWYDAIKIKVPTINWYVILQMPPNIEDSKSLKLITYEPKRFIATLRESYLRNLSDRHWQF